MAHTGRMLHAGHRVICLIATLPRLETLQERALPSIQRQTRRPDIVVIVADQRSLTAEDERNLCMAAPSVQIKFLVNERETGVAGTWNSGLKFIARHYPSCYVAILDDDDEWDPDHIQVCCETARRTGWPDVVISGLRICKDGHEVPRSPPTALQVEDFLSGNPGWQGSNTFASIQLLGGVGMFTEGLTSTNDRDLAIRILSREGTSVAFTGSHTATWYIESHRLSLSSPKSETKRRGLAHFLHLHGHRMTPEILEKFFSRAQLLFGVGEEEILGELWKFKHD